MSRRNRRASATWAWRRWIPIARQDDWIARLEAAGCATWTATMRAGTSRLLLAVYATDRAGLAPLQKQFGGRVRAVAASSWLSSKPTPPTRIGKKLEIFHDEKPRQGKSTAPRLHIPHGLAFGSGEHATTFMLLRALAQSGDWSRARVLDLGTGSGVLALAARKFGARKIVATDFDADAVRTARQNEALNFSTPLIRWQRADVKKLRATTPYDLVLGNLFSGILIEAAKPIAASVSSGGELWLSGILDSQRDEVTTAYRRQGLELTRTYRRGKWVMLQFAGRSAPA